MQAQAAGFSRGETACRHRCRAPPQPLPDRHTRPAQPDRIYRPGEADSCARNRRAGHLVPSGMSASSGCMRLSLNVFQPMCGIFSALSVGAILSTSPLIQPRPFNHFVLAADFRHQVRTDTNAEKRPAFPARHFIQAHRPCRNGAEPAPAIGKRADARQHHAVGVAHFIRVVGDEDLADRVRSHAPRDSRSLSRPSADCRSRNRQSQRSRLASGRCWRTDNWHRHHVIKLARIIGRSMRRGFRQHRRNDRRSRLRARPAIEKSPHHSCHDCPQRRRRDLASASATACADGLVEASDPISSATSTSDVSVTAPRRETARQNAATTITNIKTMLSR